MNLLAKISPAWALKRELHKAQLQAIKGHSKRTYDAATQSQYHVRHGNRHSADAVMQHANDTLRNEARWLDENHDLVIGILDELVNNIVGTGVVVEPMVKSQDGKLNEKINTEIRKHWAEFCRRPEVTAELSMGVAQRLACRSWLRDGELFAQHIEGQRLQSQAAVPYAFELIEADFLPFNDHFLSPTEGITHGIKKNAWGKPTEYHFYKQHPGDVMGLKLLSFDQSTKAVFADNIEHLKFTRRLHQSRGVTILHGVLRRLEDIKDYEESERIAARIAASFSAAITREGGSGSAYNNEASQDFEMQSGMIFHLQQGENVQTIDTNRPNTGLNDFRKGQLRACASGTGTKHSAISRDYNGTYSAQRQEMVEARTGYLALRDQFVSQFLEPIYRRFIENAVTFGAIKAQAGVDADSLFNADFRGPGMPWIDPKKEAEADAIKITNRLASRHQIIKERNGDPLKVDEQIQREREQDKAAGIKPAEPAQQPEPQPIEEEDDA